VFRKSYVAQIERTTNVIAGLKAWTIFLGQSLPKLPRLRPEASERQLYDSCLKNTLCEWQGDVTGC
jgi:hypothetical protein